MTRLAVLTPSYAPDIELYRDLNRSLLEWAPPDAHHHVIVPPRDGKRFAGLRGPRTDVDDRRAATTSDAGPAGRQCLAEPPATVPAGPGWAMQQLVKLHAAELDVDLLVLADSDVVFVRPVSADTFREGRRVRLPAGRRRPRRHAATCALARRSAATARPARGRPAAAAGLHQPAQRLAPRRRAGAA